MICPACGARNGERARWCTQCYTVFDGAGDDTDDRDPPDAAPPAAPVPPDLPPGVAPVVPAPVVPAPDGAGPAAGTNDADTSGDERDVRVRDDQVEWRCSACGTWSSLRDPACRGCGSPRAGFTPEDHRMDPTPRAGRAMSLAATVLLPGLGHLLRGMSGLGSAVLLLWLLWGGGALLSRGGAAPLTVVLGLAALALWAGSLLDLWQRLDDRAPVLSGRVLAWSTVAVTGLLVVVAIGGGLGAGG